MDTTATNRHILLYFGSFNPIHTGHIELARYALTHTVADELWLVLSPHNPLKTKEQLWDDDFRLSLTQKAVAKFSDIKVSDIEFSLPQPNYTYVTLRTLREKYPDTQFDMLIGADNHQIFDHWKQYQEILQNHQVWVYPRNGITPDKAQFPQMRWLEAPLFPISSTMIREKISRKESIHGLVPIEIEQTIERKAAENQDKQ